MCSSKLIREQLFIATQLHATQQQRQISAITYVAKAFNGRFENDREPLDTLFRFQVTTHNGSFVKRDLQYANNLGMISGRNSKLLQSVKWKWHKHINTYLQTFTSLLSVGRNHYANKLVCMNECNKCKANVHKI